VREAIQKLAWQGLVVVKPRVGLQIAEIKPTDHAHVMQVRRELEPIAAALVADHATEGQRNQLVECAQSDERLRGQRRSGGLLRRGQGVRRDPRGCLSQRLHHLGAWLPVQTHSRRLWYSKANPERMDRSISLHVAVIRAIQQGKAGEARKAMTALIDYLGHK
jgi:DNA-binding GntR family transcriptional regulator